MNNKINKLCERALQIVYDDYKSSFEKLLIKYNSLCILHQNIRRLMIEIYKSFNKADVYNGFSVRSSQYFNLRYQQDLVIPLVNSVLKGKNPLRYF